MGVGFLPCQVSTVLLLLLLLFWQSFFFLVLRMLISLSVEFVRIAFLLFGFPDHNKHNVLGTETSLCAFNFMEAYRADTQG